MSNSAHCVMLPPAVKNLIETQPKKPPPRKDKNTNHEKETEGTKNTETENKNHNDEKGGEEIDCVKGFPFWFEKKKPESEPWKRRKMRIFPRIREPDLAGETPEQTALRRLRSRLRPFVGHPTYKGVVCLSDRELVAWIKSCNFNVYLVEAKLLQHYEVRRKLELDRILVDYKPPEALKLHYTGGLCGVDRENCPIWYELLGAISMKNLMRCVSMQEVVLFKFYQFEKVREAAKTAGVSQALVLVDMRGLNREAIGTAQDIWIEFIKILQNHYPYLVKEFIIFHRPPISMEFTLALRPYLNRLTMSKVTYLGRDYLNYLIQKIPKHEIPALYGGYKCDIDNNPLCRKDLLWDGQVPTWMHHTDPRLAAHMTDLNIQGGHRLVKETHVATPSSHMFWNFYSLSHPVLFSVYRDRIHPDHCIVDETLVNTASVQDREKGCHCDRAGRYLTVLDNCKNFARPVKGVCRITLIPPDWLTAKLSQKKPLGDAFSMLEPIGEEERNLLHWKHSHEPHQQWETPVQSPSVSSASSHDILDFF